jgi:hypothetical protein
MSTNQAANGVRKVVVAPVIRSGNSELLKFGLIWLGSAVIQGGLLALAFFVFTLLDVRATAAPDQPDVAPTTEVEEAPKEPDLTNTDIGIDDSVQLNFNVDRIEDVSVPGPVDPTAPVGVAAAPEESVRTNVPPPPGAGGGTGAAPSLADAGAGSMIGTLGGMGGAAFTGAFSGRSGATREKMVNEGGGNELSEAAVARGLLWLALHQAPDGHWGLHDFYRYARDKEEPGAKIQPCNCDPGTTRRNDIAATGFALLPYLAAGVTHKPASAKNAQKDYTKVVNAGLQYLMRKQGSDGYYGGDMYSHGIASIAMCEAYGLTSDPTLKTSAQRALNFIVAAQDTAGGWRYAPKMAGDTSVTGWELMAIKSGQMSGLSVPRNCLTLAERFLDSVETSQKGTYGYMPGAGATPTMTAVGLLCRQYQGVNPRNPGLLAGIDYLKKNAPPGVAGLYYDYYATQVFHHMGGESWQFWNAGPNGKNGIRDTLIARQQHNSGNKQHIEGSWSPEQAPEGGRIMATSLSLLCLEVYYRHLPLYRRDMGVIKNEK